MSHSPENNPPPTEPPPVPNVEPRYAGFWIRVGAWMIDFLIVLVPSIAIAFVGAPALYLLLALLLILYKPFFESLLAATPGKMLLGLQVTDTGLKKVGFASAVIRNVFAILPGLTNTFSGYKQKAEGINPFNPQQMEAFTEANKMLVYGTWVLLAVWIVTVLFVAFTRHKKGLHDMLADTRVVYKETLPKA
ncbi:MAG: RDD family protein [Opitutales bacterium]